MGRRDLYDYPCSDTFIGYGEEWHMCPNYGYSRLPVSSNIERRVSALEGDVQEIEVDLWSSGVGGRQVHVRFIPAPTSPQLWWEKPLPKPGEAMKGIRFDDNK